MRTPERWFIDYEELGSSQNREVILRIIAEIQSDASRSAARSERERCAEVCEGRATRYNCESGRWERDAVLACAKHIRYLPRPGRQQRGGGMKRFLRRVFCRHRHQTFMHNIHGDAIIHCGWNRSWWACDRCGSWRLHPEYVVEPTPTAERRTAGEGT